jgi:hypothetical protein
MGGAASRAGWALVAVGLVVATGCPRSSPTACEGLDYCACGARAACEVVADGCLCPCDFGCPRGCVCACGGGKFLGCRARAEAGPPPGKGPTPAARDW